MKENQLPISCCHANCSNCSLPSDFKMFESGAGGDFETFLGSKTQSIYRLNLGQIHYLKKDRNELLLEAKQIEGELIQIPQDLSCKICGAKLYLGTIMIDGEEIITAFEI